MSIWHTKSLSLGWTFTTIESSCMSTNPPPFSSKKKTIRRRVPAWTKHQAKLVSNSSTSMMVSSVAKICFVGHHFQKTITFTHSKLSHPPQVVFWKPCHGTSCNHGVVQNHICPMEKTTQWKAAVQHGIEDLRFGHSNKSFLDIRTTWEP